MMRTCASARSSECVIVSSEDRPPIAANRRPAPPCNWSCGGPPRRTTSTSRQSTPCEWPVPSAFIAASFAANRPAKWMAGTRRARAVRDLAFGEDAVQEALAVAFDRVGDAVDVGCVQAQADDVRHACQTLSSRAFCQRSDRALRRSGLALNPVHVGHRHRGPQRGWRRRCASRRGRGRNGG